MDFLLADFGIVTCLVIFSVTAFAKTYGSVYGGGSFLIQPMLMAFGLPPQVAVANDGLGSIGTILSVGMIFKKAKEINFDVVKRWLLWVSSGTFAGVALLAILPVLVLKILLLTICITGVVTMILPVPDLEISTKRNSSWRFITFKVGAYLGFSGAGVTTLCVAFMRRIERLSFKQSVGSSKILFFIPSILAVIQYFYMGWIALDLAAMMFVASMLGGWVGAHAALRLSEKFLKTTFLVAAVFVFIIAGVDLMNTIKQI